MSSDDEEGSIVEASVPLLSEKGFVAETPCYGFKEDEEEEDEEEENDQEVDDDNEQTQLNKHKRLTVSNKNKKQKKLSFNIVSRHEQIVSPTREQKNCPAY